MIGHLTIVPTPIGNTADWTSRAIESLQACDVIACEDTRTTRKLLKQSGIELASNTRLLAYHDHNELPAATELVRMMLAGEHVCLVSDAGTPLMSDPGYILVKLAAKAEVPIVPLPGACAVICALSGAGLPSSSFVFIGFLPRQKEQRRTTLCDRGAGSDTVIAYESPHRLLACLADIAHCLPNRQVVVARSLTKKWEQYYRGTATELLEAFEPERKKLKGEFVVLIAGSTEKKTNPEVWELIDKLASAGVSAKVIRDVVGTTFKVPKREIYQRVLNKEGS